MPTTPAVEKTLYKGKVTIKFFPDSHIYYVDGKRVGSVTGCINIIDKSQALIPWAVETCGDFLATHIGTEITRELIDEAMGQHEIKKAAAANIGTAAHAWMEEFVKGENPEMPEDKNVLQAVNGFLSWVEEHKIKFLEAEKLLYSKKHKYVGLMDATATMEGSKKKYVIDYKVSNGLYPGVAYQTAAYMAADQEESGIKYAGRWAIRLSKETEEEYMDRQQKKVQKYLRKNPGKEPYQITPYQAFEARFLDEVPRFERDFHAFVLAKDLASVHKEVDQEFFAKMK